MKHLTLMIHPLRHTHCPTSVFSDRLSYLKFDLCLKTKAFVNWEGGIKKGGFDSIEG